MNKFEFLRFMWLDLRVIDESEYNQLMELDDKLFDERLLLKTERLMNVQHGKLKLDKLSLIIDKFYKDEGLHYHDRFKELDNDGKFWWQYKNDELTLRECIYLFTKSGQFDMKARFRQKLVGKEDVAEVIQITHTVDGKDVTFERSACASDRELWPKEWNEFLDTKVDALSAEWESK